MSTRHWTTGDMFTASELERRRSEAFPELPRGYSNEHLIEQADREMEIVDLLASGKARIREMTRTFDGPHDRRIEVTLDVLDRPRRTRADREAALRHLFRALMAETPDATPFEIFERGSEILMRLADEERKAGRA